MTVIILLSHYQKLATELRNYLELMIGKENPNVNLEALGGIEDGKVLGTDPDELIKIIQKYSIKTKFIIFCDLGSAILTAEAVKIILEEYCIHISKGSFLESAFSTYCLAFANVEYSGLLIAADEKITK